MGLTRREGVSWVGDCHLWIATWKELSQQELLLAHEKREGGV